MIPTIRPKDAPMAMDGTKMPAGTLQPYEIITKKTRRIVAVASENTIDHRYLALVKSATRMQSYWSTLTRKVLYSRCLLHIPETKSPSSQSC
jgi:hypothetical protein